MLVWIYFNDNLESKSRSHNVKVVSSWFTISYFITVWTDVYTKVHFSRRPAQTYFFRKCSKLSTCLSCSIIASEHFNKNETDPVWASQSFGYPNGSLHPQTGRKFRMIFLEQTHRHWNTGFTWLRCELERGNFPPCHQSERNDCGTWHKALNRNNAFVSW